MTTKRTARPLTVGDPTFFAQRTALQDPMMLAAELLRNVFRHAGGDAMFFPGSQGELCCRDNGRGMKPDEMMHLAGLGSSGGQVGGAGDQGVGAKYYVVPFSPEGVEWISLAKGGHQAHRLELFVQDLPGGRRTFGPLEQDGEIIFPCPTPRTLSGHGTLVRCKGLPYNANQLHQFLNGMALEPQNGRTITVARPHGEATRDEPVVGLLEAQRRVAMDGNYGVVDVGNADVYWAVMRPQEELDSMRFCQWEFKPNTVYYCWNGWVYKSWGMNRNAGAVLARWGITAAASRMMLVVVAKDPSGTPKSQRIVPSDDRSEFKNWDELGAQEAFKAEIPEQLELFLAAFKRRHWEDQPERELVQELLNACLRRSGALAGLAGPAVGLPKTLIRAGGTRKSGADATPREDRGGSRSKPKARLDYVCVNDEELKGRKAEIRDGTLYINMDYPDISGIIAQAGGNLREEKVLRALIVTEAVANLTRYMEASSNPVTDDVVFAAVSGLMLARMRAMMGKRMVLPLIDISVAEKPKGKR